MKTKEDIQTPYSDRQHIGIWLKHICVLLFTEYVEFSS